MDEIVSEFLVESHENLDRLDRELIALEQEPSNRELLASIFRIIHTIKGSCAFLGFSKLESVTHVGENLLSRLRDGVIGLNPERTTALLALVDAVRQILATIQRAQNEGDTDYTQLIEILTRLQQDEDTGDPWAMEPVLPAAAPEARPAAVAPVASSAPRPEPVAASTKSAQPVAVDPGSAFRKGAPADSPAAAFGEVLVSEGRAQPVEVAEAVRRQQDGDPRRIGELLVEQGAIAPQDVVDVLRKQGEKRPAAAGPVDNTIRVDVHLLDKLMNLVGELVLARNQILQFTASPEGSTLVATSQRLNLITTELQEGVMKTRMQPIGTVWNKLPRVVRDLATSCGKQIRLEMEGSDTELDKTLIEAIKDPLTHVVRNAVDHGIESPEARVRRGKSAEGCLTLRAYHEGGQVNIEIADDGAGIDPEKVRQKALSRGLITADQAARMGDREATSLIFLPGFSTAEKVTNISGRGVGMDVVKTNIEKIGGSVDIQSAPGTGTTLKIKIPLTLAIIPALVVTSGGERFAIPQVSLLELVRLEGHEARKGLETILGAPVYRLRGNLLPLIFLNRELQMGVAEKGAAGLDEDAINIVVLQADDRSFGLVVDDINDTQEIVVKPLGKQLKALAVFAGATIMGDGRVALILDVMGLAQRASVISEVRDRALAERSDRQQNGDDVSQTLLLFDVGEHGRMAIPLSAVARLEEFPRSAVEWAGSQEVVQYRGSILPLVHLSHVLVERRKTPRSIEGVLGDSGKETLQVLVYTSTGRTWGVVVGKILDVVEETLAGVRPATRPGILGTLVIQNRVTQLLDIEAIVKAAEQSRGASFDARDLEDGRVSSHG